jgi:hypothetical protein
MGGVGKFTVDFFDGGKFLLVASVVCHCLTFGRYGAKNQANDRRSQEKDFRVAVFSNKVFILLQFNILPLKCFVYIVFG